MLLFLTKNKLQLKKILKKESIIKKDKTIICEFSLKIFERSLTGKKPPDEISVKARFNESKALIEKIFFAHKKLVKHQRTWIKKIPNLRAFQSADTAKNEIMEYLSY